MDLKSRILDIGPRPWFLARWWWPAPSLWSRGQKSTSSGSTTDMPLKMGYLKRDPERRTTPSMTFSPVRSIIVASVSYYQEIPPPPERYVWGRVAAYAIGLDYHQIIRQKLELYADLIEREIGRPSCSPLCH
jgi:epoxyqueuosine reductase QueG